MRNKIRLRQQYQTVAVALAAMLLLSGSVGTKAHGSDRVASSGSVIFSIEDLGTFGSSTRAYGINNSGQVVGYSFTAPGPSSFAHAFRFTDGVGLIDLNQFTLASIAYGAGVNNSGQVSGSVDASGGGGKYHAFRYTDGIGLVDLGSLPGYSFSEGSRVNDRGQVVGRAYKGLVTLDVSRAFRFTDSLGMQDLGTLWGGSFAFGINNSGEVVGHSETPTTPSNDIWNPGHAYLYTDSMGMQDLNNLIDPSLGWELREANAINNRGQIVGFGEHAGVGLHAFRYDHGDVQDLGTFPGGGISYALGINSRGDVVGAAYLDASGAGNFRAMLYTDQRGIENLNELIDPSTGWVLRQAFGINDRGQIAGWGVLNGQERAFRLTPLSCCLAGPACTIIVPGTSNPWLAGAPAGTTTPDGDSAPAQSPVPGTCLAFAPGDRLTFNASGNVSNCLSGCPASGPDGGETVSHLYGGEFGISDTSAPLNSLVGVFLGPSPPGPPTPPASNFSTPALQRYGNLSPLLGQMFFIGDGRVLLTGADFCQGVIVPPGATRLFLGTMDGFDWKNNVGNFAVTICKQSSICLQDDSNGNTLRFNTATGHYLFTRCSDGFTLTGRGLVTVSGCTISLRDFVIQLEPPPFGPPTPFNLTASVNTCSMQGTASLTVTARRLVRVFTIKDTNTADSTCSCPGSELPDLVPEPLPGSPSPIRFCRLDVFGRLVVRVRNQGSAASDPTFTRVEFSTGAFVDLPTPMIPADGVVDLVVPPGFLGPCAHPDCDFTITVDFGHDVVESDESNNTADGICIG